MIPPGYCKKTNKVSVLMPIGANIHRLFAMIKQVQNRNQGREIGTACDLKNPLFEQLRESITHTNSNWNLKNKEQSNINTCRFDYV